MPDEPRIADTQILTTHMAKKAAKKETTGANLGFEAKLRLAADKLRLKGALNKNYGRADLDKHRLGELIDLIGSIELANSAPSPLEGERAGVRGTSDVDCMVAMLGQLFYSTQIPVCLWFLTKNKKARPGRQSGGKFRDHRGETLFIDARKLGTLIDRVHRDLTDADLARIVETYHAWRGDAQIVKQKSKIANYAAVPGFCKSAPATEIAAHGHVLTPGRYVGAEEVEDDGEPFEEKMPRLVAELHAQFAESARLEQAINANLKGLGFDRQT